MLKQQPQPAIYKLKVTFKDTEPVIWRRFVVPSNITLHRLHLILQEVMGWTNSHLYRFEIDKKEYGVLYPNNDFDELDFIDSKKAKLNHLVTTKGDTFVYEYDFGDGWAHELVVEDISEPIAGNIYPVCLEGERTCPPEDCGGPHGYSTLLGIIANPDNKEYEEMITWLGDSFRPDLFNAGKVNRRLKPIQLR
jgi:hypothetical protein